MIRLQFVQGDDLASKAIEIFERGWPSHVDAVLPDGRLLGARSDTIGDIPPGVQIRPADYNIWSKRQIVTPKYQDFDSPKFLDFLNQQIGKPYDSTAIAAFAVERDWRETDSWFCSELQAAALETCGFFPKPLSNPSNEITPRDLLLLLSPWRLEL